MTTMTAVHRARQNHGVEEVMMAKEWLSTLPGAYVTAQTSLSSKAPPSPPFASLEGL